MRLKVVCGLLTLLFGLLIGSQGMAGEDEVRQAWGQLQKAVKTRDGEKLWNLLDSDAQTAATRAAKLVQLAYGKAGTKDKMSFEKKYGLTSKELSAMNARLFLKSNRFHSKYYEVPDSKVESVKVQEDTAQLNSIEDDGDKVKFSLVRQKGQWKFSLTMPRAVE